MADPVSLTLSVLALSISAVTAWDSEDDTTDGDFLRADAPNSA
jgi:hypothetical protein